MFPSPQETCRGHQVESDWRIQLCYRGVIELRERCIAPGMSPDIAAAIDKRLDDIRCEHNVAIPLAIESGSRAWGFPSPDSDYDCRFIFLRPRDAYLSPWQPRDVIETPLDPIFDVNGWDLGKAVKLMAGGNAVIIEWLTSPIVYNADPVFKRQLLDLAVKIARREMIGYHYLSLGMAMFKRLLNEQDAVRQKKIFYALRPAMALRWLRQRSEEVVAPMHFPSLVSESGISAGLSEEIAALMARKAETRELGTAPLSNGIRQFLQEEFAIAELLFGKRVHAEKRQIQEEAAAFFREMVCSYRHDIFTQSPTYAQSVALSERRL